MRASLRFIAAVMITSGVLLIADAGVTLAWQEPVSALIALRHQAELDDQLDGATKRFEGAVGNLAALAARYARETGTGDALGRIELPTLDRSYVMVEGTGTSTLRKGPGHFPDTPLPGRRGTVAVAGHRTTYLAPFRTIDQLERGDEIVIEMPYARFKYEVEGSRIVEPTEYSVTKRVGYDRIVLSACHPLYSASKRVVVFGRLRTAERP